MVPFLFLALSMASNIEQQTDHIEMSKFDEHRTHL